MEITILTGIGQTQKDKCCKDRYTKADSQDK